MLEHGHLNGEASRQKTVRFSHGLSSNSFLQEPYSSISLPQDSQNPAEVNLDRDIFTNVKEKICNVVWLVFIGILSLNSVKLVLYCEQQALSNNHTLCK